MKKLKMKRGICPSNGATISSCAQDQMVEELSTLTLIFFADEVQEAYQNCLYLGAPGRDCFAKAASSYLRLLSDWGSGDFLALSINIKEILTSDLGEFYQAPAGVPRSV